MRSQKAKQQNRDSSSWYFPYFGYPLHKSKWKGHLPLINVVPASPVNQGGSAVHVMASPVFSDTNQFFNTEETDGVSALRRRSTGAPEGIHAVPYNVYCRRSSVQESDPIKEHKKSSFLSNLRLAHRTRGHSISCDEDVEEGHDWSLLTPSTPGHSSEDSGNWSPSPNSIKDKVFANMFESFRPRSKSDSKQGRVSNSHLYNRQATTMKTIPSVEEFSDTSPIGKANRTDVRKIPLYVDTQLANRIVEHDRVKKSPIFPVNAVIDFVRGSRKQHSPSLDQGSQQMQQHHFRRISATASYDRCSPPNQLASSPCRRHHLTAMKSLDSGLDLSQQSHSPSTAIVFKQEAYMIPQNKLLRKALYKRRPSEESSRGGSIKEESASLKPPSSPKPCSGDRASCTALHCRSCSASPPAINRAANPTPPRSPGSTSFHEDFSVYATVRGKTVTGLGPLKVSCEDGLGLRAWKASPSPRYMFISNSDIPPVYDIEGWHEEGNSNENIVYTLFAKAHKCYDLVPISSKLVVFDTQLSVRKAFYALVYNGVRAAPLWDSASNQFVGMLTITDFIRILVKYKDKGGELEQHRIHTWKQVMKGDVAERPLVSIDPSDSLFKAVETLLKHKIHRLPVIDKTTGNVLYILTHKRILKFISLYISDLPRPAYLHRTPKDLGIGVWSDIATVTPCTRLRDALSAFLDKRVSALPVVDAEGKVVDIYAKFDVINLAAEKSYDNLDITIEEALKHRKEWFEGVRSCGVSDKLQTVMEALVKAEVHRVVILDTNGKLTGLVSLSDILSHIVLDPPPATEVNVMEMEDGET